MKKPRESKRMSDEAVKERTGMVWAEWFKILDKAGARKWQHREIAAYLKDERKVGPWWGQMLAVGYEQERGLREKFQKCDGEFAATGSRTMSAPIPTLFKSWTDEKLRLRWLPGAKLEITTAIRGKSVRAKWGGGKSRLSVNFYAKGAAKSQVTVDHMKLASSKECAAMKAYWFDALNSLQKMVEN